ncbi:exodeoxyribonuclease III, partial [bacterium]|nr:exodeoxyribonuclease III [bacterium]
MKIFSWNVNGIRAILKKNFKDFLKEENPDILCLQEIKIANKDIEKEDIQFDEYEVYWNSAERPGYSGTATLVKKNIKSKILDKLGWDNEGRVQLIDLGEYYLANVYFPNANNELSRLDFKIEFNDKLLNYFKKLEKEKPLIICGDYNVAHKEIDLARPKENVGNPGFTKEERDWMIKFLGKGFKDVFREQNPEKIQYSWWSYRAFARV